MKKMNKKLISILLAVIMIFGTTAVGLTAFAAEGYEQFNDSYHRNIAENKLEPHTYGAYDSATGTATCTLCDHVHKCLEHGHVDTDGNCQCDICGDVCHTDGTSANGNIEGSYDDICDYCGSSMHTWILSSHEEATCTKKDIYHYVCKVCNEDKTVEGFNILGHLYDLRDEKVEKVWTGLDSNDPDSYVSCEATFVCQRCQDKQTRKVENYEVTVNGSIKIDENLATPSCLTGFVKYIATFYIENKAGETATYTTTATGTYGALGHSPAEPVEENRIEPTCGEPGSYESVVYCSREGCHAELSRESIPIPATGNHNYNVMGFCTVCGAHDCEGKGHSYIGGYEMDDSSHWKECAYCGAISSDGNVASADGIKAPHVDANEDGMCDVCTYSKGHKWQLSSNQNPTCSAPGYNVYTCAFHPDESKTVELPPLGHYWYDDHNEADRQYVTFSFSSNFESCTLTLKCRRPECGQTVSYTVYTDPSDNGAVLANATTNKPISKGTDANCEAGSGKSYYAIFTISQKLKEMGLDDADLRTVNEIINEDSELRDIIQANGLNPKLNVNEKGLVCIMTFEDGETPALGHIYEDPAYMEGGENYQPNGDATCTKDGTRTAPCDRCGKVSDTVPDDGSALGHNFREEDVVITPATCTEDGLATGTCTRCNQKNEQVIPALGHDWVEDESKYVAPTCGKEGQKVSECSRCHETKTEAIEALAHTPDPSKAVVVAPTCTAQGYTKNYCSVCQQYYNTDYTPALGHTWGEWSEKIYYGDDDTKDGYQIRVCEVCGATEQKEVPGSAPGHLYVYTDIGDEDHHLVICAHCGEPKDYKAHVDGNYDFICDECGHEMSFWHHWLHYLVGLPTYGFGNFFTRMMDAFTKFIRMITKDMI